MLKINKYTGSKEQFIQDEKNAFAIYFAGVPEKILFKYLDKYYFKCPFPENICKYMLCSAFELLFLLAALLVDDNLDCDKVYELGYAIGYAKHKNNPYEFSWFEECTDDENNITILDYLQQVWLPDNYNEFENIYDICKRYKQILTIDNIWEIYNNVIDY